MATSTRKRAAKPMAVPAPAPFSDKIDTVLRPRWWDELLALYVDCRQRILIVADGALNFSPGSAFGLTETVAALQSGAPGFMPVTITTAHRASGTGATHLNFRFDAPPVPLTRANFDQVWLFGIASGLVSGTFTRNTNTGSYNPNLGINDNEIRALAAFMEAGGGVFATGDHSSLGRAMCGLLPRVRQMRNWIDVPMGLEGLPTALGRIDTMADPMSNTLYEFDDQSDEQPQRLYPHYRQGAGGAWLPHPLLSSPSRTIDVFPDHPHESECRTAATPGASYTEAGLSFAEFPSAGGSQPLPEVVASSMSGGRAVPVNATTAKPPVTPRSFGAISAYDGDAVSRGRIVCDSTWHHFVNVNLNGVGTPFLPGLGSARTAFAGVPAVYDQIKRYFNNIARWLAPANRRRCRLWLEVIDVRFNTFLIEELPIPRPGLPDPPPWDVLRGLGANVRAALAGRVGQAAADADLDELLLGDKSAAGLATYFGSRGKEAALLDPAIVRDVVTGAFVHHLADRLPQTAEQLVQSIKPKTAHRIIDEAFDPAVQRGVKLATDSLQRAARAELEALSALGIKPAR